MSGLPRAQNGGKQNIASAKKVGGHYYFASGCLYHLLIILRVHMLNFGLGVVPLLK